MKKDSEPDVHQEYRRDIARLESKARLARKMGQGHTAMKYEEEAEKLSKELYELEK